MSEKSTSTSTKQTNNNAEDRRNPTRIWFKNVGNHIVKDHLKNRSDNMRRSWWENETGAYTV